MERGEGFALGYNMLECMNLTCVFNIKVDEIKSFKDKTLDLV